MRQEEAIETLRQQDGQECHVLFFLPWEMSPKLWQGTMAEATCPIDGGPCTIPNSQVSEIPLEADEY